MKVTTDPPRAVDGDVFAFVCHLGLGSLEAQPEAWVQEVHWVMILGSKCERAGRVNPGGGSISEAPGVSGGPQFLRDP